MKIKLSNLSPDILAGVLYFSLYVLCSSVVVCPRVRVYVHMCVCTYVRMCARVHVCTCACVHVRTCARVHVCMCACVHW